MLYCKKIVSKMSSNFTYSCDKCRLISNLVKEKNVLKDKALDFKTSKENLQVQFKNYMKENQAEFLLPFIPRRLIRRKCKGTSSLYLVIPQAAKELASIITKDLYDNMSFVIECNPGIGLLTEELLKAGVTSIHLFEKGESFYLPSCPLPMLIEKYSDRLIVKNLDFSDVWITLLREKYCEEKLSSKYLADMPRRSWEDNSFAQVIAFCSTRKFLALMIHNFAFQTSIYDYGRPCFYLAVPNDIWERAVGILEDNQYYSNVHVFLHLFFDFKVLGYLPRNVALPWAAKNTLNTTSSKTFSIVKIEPKKNAFHSIERQDLQSFWYFLRYGMRSNKRKIIEELEKVVQGCGPRLIHNNINICSTFKEMSPSKLLQIFQIFRQWPEYDVNMFSPLVEDPVDQITSEDEDEAKLEKNKH